MFKTVANERDTTLGTVRVGRTFMRRGQSHLGTRNMAERIEEDGVDP